MPRIAVDGMKFYYQQAGHGRDVVLLHGVSGNLAIWPLINMVETLAADFRVTVYDQRGHGYSDTPPTGYTSADQAEDLLKLKNALRLGPMYVLGHSFGGVIAHHTAVLDPEAVAGLILSDPLFPALRHLETSVSQWTGWQDYKEQAERAGLTITEEAWFDVGQLLQQTIQLTPERYAMFQKELGNAALQRLVRLAGTTCGEDVKAVAGLTVEKILSVQQPALALYGEQSPFLTTCRYLEEHLPNCKVAIVPKALHRAHEENGPAYVEIVQKYLREMAGLEGTWDSGKREMSGVSA